MLDVQKAKHVLDVIDGQSDDGEHAVTILACRFIGLSPKGKVKRRITRTRLMSKTWDA